MIPAPVSRTARIRAFAAFAALPLVLSGCNMVVLHPDGDVAQQQAQLVLISTVLMLLIIIPVMALTILFAWRYRESNRDAKYEPDWDHSTQLELVIWSAPLLIIIALGALTWISTHKLDPYRPLDRIAPGKPIAANEKPLEIQVVSLDWKWLFIYPEQGIATVNELKLPVNRQIRFRLSSSSVMNAFYVPTLAGMIYTMPGMETKLHAVLNKTGNFGGISANYSGSGYSYMNFTVQGMDQAGFDNWAAGVRAGGGGALSAAEYAKLEKPSEKNPVAHYPTVMAGLFDRIVNQCVQPGQTCTIDTMMHDMGHGGGKPGVNNTGEAPHAPGALLKDQHEHDVSPSRGAPTDPEAAPGKTDPGNAANRNMTRNDIPARPGVQPAARS